MLDEHVKTIEKQREEQIESLKLIENEIKELKQLENLYPAIDLYDTAADNWYIYIFDKKVKCNSNKKVSALKWLLC